ncbi:DUF899 domain-containing protein [Sporichthya sp.]|uniref:DUF899 domain-containing protein n=1 Tax=Sporichthya sp. TaxID=65475 RepID=UPI0017AAA23E|nr:DUF899 domain-containing protein [Sporichthya sp.]MBA3743646.1 DUF899 domain-containing protein [Sporichthya sp.]
MDTPAIVDPATWLQARRALLELEKEETRRRDRINRARRALPAVRVEQPYEFTGPDGVRTLAELFDGRGQLIVLHLMFGPGWGRSCAGCAFHADAIGNLAHLHARDTTLVAVSRAPYSELTAFAERMGWTFPWYSSAGSTFNYDFGVSLDERVAPVLWNYRSAEDLRQAGLGALAEAEELNGVSVFLRPESPPDAVPDVLHTYSTYGRGVELLLGTYMWLDLTPHGRGEGWDGMPDLGGGLNWVRLHDEYGTTVAPPCEHTFCISA